MGEVGCGEAVTPDGLEPPGEPCADALRLGRSGLGVTPEMVLALEQDEGVIAGHVAWPWVDAGAGLQLNQ